MKRYAPLLAAAVLALAGGQAGASEMTPHANGGGMVCPANHHLNAGGTYPESA